MQRFIIAADISKQLITVSTSLIVATAAFQEKILQNGDSRIVFNFIAVFLILNFVSIVSGVFHLGAIVNGVEVAEKPRAKFVSVFDNNLGSKLCLTQQLTFISSMLLFLICIFVDRTLPTGLSK